MCSRVTTWRQNFLDLLPAHQQRTSGMDYWCQICVTRKGWAAQLKRPVGKCLVLVILLHGTSVANLHFFILRLKLRFIGPVIRALYWTLCRGVVEIIFGFKELLLKGFIFLFGVKVSLCMQECITNPHVSETAWWPGLHAILGVCGVGHLVNNEWWRQGYWYWKRCKFIFHS